MKIIKINKVISLGLAVLLTTFSTVLAGEKQDVSGLIENLQILGPPETVKVTPGGVRIIRGLPLAADVTGDLVGVFALDQNSSFNTNGDGGAHGQMVLELSWNGLSGMFEGQAGASIKGFFVTSTQVLRGSGDFEGYRFNFVMEGFIGGPFLYTGTLKIP